MVCWEWGKAREGSFGSLSERGRPGGTPEGEREALAELRFSWGVNRPRMQRERQSPVAVCPGGRRPCPKGRVSWLRDFRAGGTASSLASPCLGPLSLRLQFGCQEQLRGGCVKQSKRPLCGTGFLRIAVAGLEEVSPAACMA